jgi:hypothetical protein
MKTLGQDTLIQIDILHDLRRAGKFSDGMPCTAGRNGQLTPIVIALTNLLGPDRDLRIKVLRTLCEYDEMFASSKQLTANDASALIEWMFGHEPPGEDTVTTVDAVLAILDIKEYHE